MSAVLSAPNRLRTVRLYGKAGAMFGRVHRFAVNSPKEAVQALISQCPGFERYLMTAKDKGFGFSVFIGKRNLKEEELGHPPGNEDIRIAPVLFGSKDSGWLNVLVGAALIVTGAIVSLGTGGLAAPIGGALITAGVGMAVGGVVQLLFPPPKLGKPQERPENTPSYSFAGPVNTQSQGQPVPLLLGRMIVGSAVISAGIEAKDEVYVPVPGEGAGEGGAGQVFEDGVWKWKDA